MLPLIQSMSPVVLRVAIDQYNKQCWSILSTVAPRLRCLDLEVVYEDAIGFDGMLYWLVST